MSIINRLFKILDRFSTAEEVSAHCDIPCGIYDPHLAQFGAHTVIRMTTMINELKAGSKNEIHQISRLAKVKEEHAELVKHEIRIIWGDYFKEEHLQKYPDLHNLVFKIMKLASKTKQEVNIEAANELLELVQEFAEIFWKTKGLEIVRLVAPYPTGGEIVLPKQS